MPGQAVHLGFARDVMGAGHAWRPAFDPQDAGHCQAFFAGALAPDMGYFPGGDRRLADLAHYVATGQMARSLLRQAEGGCAAAYAWGWASHIIADVTVHPIVNRAAAELMNVPGKSKLTYADDPRAHARVESGLDAWAQTHRPLPAVDPKRMRDAKTREMIRAACRQVHGCDPGRRSIDRSQRAMARLARWIPSLNLVNASALDLDSAGQHKSRVSPLGRATLHAIRALTEIFQRHSMAWALTHPVSPRPRITRGWAEVMDQCTATFLRHAANALCDLPDYNLDTGEVEPELPTYPLTIATRQWLGQCAAP